MTVWLYASIFLAATENLGRRIDDNKMPNRIGRQVGKNWLGGGAVRSCRRMCDPDGDTLGAGTFR